jgi:(S)-2-hydroxyglutarate dehydrogenase
VRQGNGGDHFDLAVIGAGLVGLASVYRILERFPDLRVVVLEKEKAPARHQSGHNSGVVHAGLYYTPGSLRARLCREGAAALRKRCEMWGVPVETRGKLVVAAAEAELPRLAELERRGRANGIKDLHMVSGDELRGVEPHVRGRQALYVPETAVVDYSLFAARLADALRDSGAELRCSAEVVAARAGASGITLHTPGGDVHAGALVTCAGLQADRVAESVGDRPSIRIVPFRGSYWVLRGHAASLVRGLIYPVPDPAFPFLGVHFTREVNGRVTAGPNAVPALAREIYRRGGISLRDASAALAWPGFLRLARKYARTGAREIWRDTVKPAAVAEMRRYLAELDGKDVVRGGCGIRAQAMARDGSLVDDFVIDEGLSSLHVLNAPSPAATSCLAIGEVVAERAAAKFGF